KGGECPLQLTTFKHGPGYSRFEGPEEKKVRRKYFLSSKIMYDPNRCIMCTRCVRFTDEVTKTSELGYHSRGFRKKIVIFPGRTLDNELAGNVIDLCPVGALLSTDTLHEERVWYWKHTDTVCPLCSNGCNVTASMDPRKGRLARVRPKPNPDVNQYWICDKGRYGFKEMQNSERLREPRVRMGEALAEAKWDEAIGAASSRFRGFLESNPDSVAILCSSYLTNEEMYLISKLSLIMGIRNIYVVVGYLTGEKKFGIISSDPYPNSEGARVMELPHDEAALRKIIEGVLGGNIKALYSIGVDILELVSEELKPRLKDALRQIPLLIAQDFKVTDTVRLASFVLPGATPYEKGGTYTNDQGRVQRVRQAAPPPGAAREDWEIISLFGRGLSEYGFDYLSTGQIMEEISKRIQAYKGLSYDKIGALGVMMTS
ncbi:MAG: molybdopterin-dependent oxidoreductase, partial [Candidatus Caldarchaeum sp.]